MTKPRILYLVTEDWYFCANRLPLARAVRDAGAEVVVATRVRRHGEAIRREGFRLVPLSWRRGGVHPVSEAAAVARIAHLYRRERPDLLHHIALKPAIHGALAAALSGAPPVVTTLTGLGAVFIGAGAKARLLRPAARAAVRLLLNRRRSMVVLQNPDDRDLLLEAGLLKFDHCRVILGDGVETERFRPLPEPPAPPVVVAFVGRMLRDKGVEELVTAARLLRERGAPVRVRLVGPTDPENPAAISEARLAAWHREGVVDWRGPVENIAALWAEAHVCVLPSYREGLPNALLEAAACARPLVASDVPGSREVVLPDQTGLRVPPRDPAALASALERLAGDSALRRRLGEAGRSLVEGRFAARIIVRQTLDLYRALLPGRLAAADAPAPAAE